MKPEQIVQFDRRVPRYTSYPTAADFTAAAAGALVATGAATTGAVVAAGATGVVTTPEFPLNSASGAADPPQATIAPNAKNNPVRKRNPTRFRTISVPPSLSR